MEETYALPLLNEEFTLETVQLHGHSWGLFVGRKTGVKLIAGNTSGYGHIEAPFFPARSNVSCPFEFPMYFLRGADILNLQRILTHADMSKELIRVDDFIIQDFWDGFEDGSMWQYSGSKRNVAFPVQAAASGAGGQQFIVTPFTKLIFVSHNWLTPVAEPGELPHPDNVNNDKLVMLQSAISRDPSLKNALFMLDYWSFPQGDGDLSRSRRQAAIRSLRAYVANCWEMWCVVVGGPEAKERYLSRGWCQLELWTAFSPQFGGVAHSGAMDISSVTPTDYVLVQTCTKVLFLMPTTGQPQAAQFHTATFGDLQALQDSNFTYEDDRANAGDVLSKILGFTWKRPWKPQFAGCGDHDDSPSHWEVFSEMRKMYGQVTKNASDRYFCMAESWLRQPAVEEKLLRAMMAEAADREKQSARKAASQAAAEEAMARQAAAERAMARQASAAAKELVARTQASKATSPPVKWCSKCKKRKNMCTCGS